ncbi:SRPBCC family protein [Arenibacter sp. GZD96]|uniref:SRPBCC family protein n=1 Tax=Aurantibrevibacter litoralis TaxID=3106030 RepID=UPI002AFE599B|nr:SRPBCC family protein [Arenibacter sp. GZD-96]MEA1784739.1 SRPBCC family protein [Arenibacter sp. GZD-96]
MGCYNSVVINAPADRVWDVLKDFHDLSWSKNVVSKVTVVGDKAATEVGARRILNDAFEETLLSFNEEAKTFTYSIDDGPGAVSKDNVSGYVGKVTVYSVSENDTAFVLWTSDWDSTTNGGVAEFCSPVYYALLQDLKLHFS